MLQFIKDNINMRYVIYNDHIGILILDKGQINGIGRAKCIVDKHHREGSPTNRSALLVGKYIETGKFADYTDNLSEIIRDFPEMFL